MISSYISLDFNLKYLKGQSYYIRELDLKASHVLTDNLALLICSYLPLKLNCSWAVAEQMIRSTEVKEQFLQVLKATQWSSHCHCLCL